MAFSVSCKFYLPLNHKGKNKGGAGWGVLSREEQEGGRDMWEEVKGIQRMSADPMVVGDGKLSSLSHVQSSMTLPICVTCCSYHLVL